jgi:hypothetical protein
MARTKQSGGGRWTAGVVAALTAGTLLLSPLAGPAAAAGPLCPAPGQVDRFGDDDGSTHEAAIDCAAAHALVSGTSSTGYHPSAPLTRGQAATILVGYVERASAAALVPDGATGFTDTSGSTHAAAIAKAAANGIVTGYADQTFRPGAVISRAQLVTMAVRATERTLGRALAHDGADAFDDDDGSVHEAAIEKAADNRLVSGVGGRRFAPAADVNRGQTASIVMGAAANVLQPAGRFAGEAPRSLSADVEWSNDRAWVAVHASHDLLWSRSWTCAGGRVSEHDATWHEPGEREVRYDGERVLLVDFAFRLSPPARTDGTQLAWYSNLVEPGRADLTGGYTAGQAC